MAFGLLSPERTLAALARGNDVYFFLVGMMVLAEIARRAALFDWIAARAVRAAAGSRTRLFALVYGACVAVTVVLSNDATAIVLTPAVAAAVRRARVPPLPHLFACAFVANAASFVLPISNPANLVVFGRALPTLGPWLQTFALPSLAAIVATYALLRRCMHRELAGAVAVDTTVPSLGRDGRIASLGIVAAAVALVVASSRGADLGATTLVAAALSLALAAGVDRGSLAAVVRGVSWSVVPLVAGVSREVA
ncbi:MAG: hypothetical protein NVSMB21_26120 [Vulcanimicrobiaceae bacterium]